MVSVIQSKKISGSAIAFLADRTASNDVMT